jgi:ADP-ribosylglycohydrolase
MEWHHLPIVDVSIPDEDFEIAWAYSGLRLREHLRAGRNVVVHCRGGLGRSGTIAGRLLVEMGWDANEAINAVRAQRRGSIETSSQEAYVRSTSLLPRDESHSIRVLGCVLGGATGDAFGYGIEFDSWASIRQKHGSLGLREPLLQGGKLVVSDDTQMTLFTLEALNLTIPTQLSPPYCSSMTRPFQAACQHAYLRWGDSQGVAVPDLYDDGDAARLYLSPGMRKRQAPGNTCLSAVLAGALGTTLYPINQSKGCGAVMRTAPIGLMPGANPVLAMELGEAAGALTHGHIDGWLPGGALSAIVSAIMNGEEIEAAANRALSLLNEHPNFDKALVRKSGTTRLLGTALRLIQGEQEATEVFSLLGEGWTGDEALAIGIYAACAEKEFKNVVRLAANHDGDSDSTASIAGQLYGARHGITAVPHDWVRRLDVLPDALRVIQHFLAVNTLSQDVADNVKQPPKGI